METSREFEPEPAGAGSLWQAVRDHLDHVRLSIHAQIHDYPRPAAGCDQQFNYLLEKRSGIGVEIGRLDTRQGLGLRHLEQMEELRRFIDASAFLDDAARRRFRAHLAHKNT